MFQFFKHPDGDLCLVMAFCEGGDLFRYIRDLRWVPKAAAEGRDAGNSGSVDAGGAAGRVRPSRWDHHGLFAGRADTLTVRVYTLR
jgi:hypothetical protein